jgi:hypothetical protein
VRQRGAPPQPHARLPSPFPHPTTRPEPSVVLPSLARPALLPLLYLAPTRQHCPPFPPGMILQSFVFKLRLQDGEETQCCGSEAPNRQAAPPRPAHFSFPHPFLPCLANLCPRGTPRPVAPAFTVPRAGCVLVGAPIGALPPTPQPKPTPPPVRFLYPLALCRAKAAELPSDPHARFHSPSAEASRPGRGRPLIKRTTKPWPL